MQRLTRCNEGKTETMEHFLWTCKTNFIEEHNKSLLNQIWDFIPSSIKGILKPEIIPSEINIFLELATIWVLSDKCHGNAINKTGQIIKFFYNTRPEIILYQSLHGNIRNTTNTRNVNETLMVGQTIQVQDVLNYEDPRTNNQGTIHGNANYDEPRVLEQSIQVQGETNYEDPRTDNQGTIHGYANYGETTDDWASNSGPG